jgi:hypothetical protein
MLPVDPPVALLVSMAMRLRHDFELDACDNNLLASGFTPEQREAMLVDMRQLYDEVAGRGFFKWPDKL